MKSHEDNSSLLNNKVYNNLGPYKSSNLEKSKLEEESMYLLFFDFLLKIYFKFIKLYNKIY